VAERILTGAGYVGLHTNGYSPAEHINVAISLKNPFKFTADDRRAIITLGRETVGRVALGSTVDVQMSLSVAGGVAIQFGERFTASGSIDKTFPSTTTSCSARVRADVTIGTTVVVTPYDPSGDAPIPGGRPKQDAPASGGSLVDER